MALLTLMSRLREQYGLRLALAHLVHGVRGEEGRKDAQFVAEMAEKLGMPIHLREVDLPRMKSEGRTGNLEAMGHQRYEIP